MAPDALEQHDRWRQIWAFFTSDWLLIPACIAAALGIIAVFVLPQMPADGQQDALAFSQWQASARDIAGGAYGFLSDIGLFGVFRAGWFWLALAGLGSLSAIRLADRVRQLVRPSLTLEDEIRLRVTESGPSIDQITQRLRAARYRVRALPSGAPDAPLELSADRGPLAAAAAAGLHAGLLLLALGAALNGLRGWELTRRQIDTGATIALGAASPASTLTLVSVDADRGLASLRLNDATVVVVAGGPPGTAYGFSARMLELTPKYRMTAFDAAGNPLTVTVSNFAPPDTSVILALRANEPEITVVLDQARLALLIAPADPAHPRGTLRVVRLPSGAALGEFPLGAVVDLDGAQARFEPLYGGVVAIRYAPGDPLLWAGAALATLGALSALAFPMRRIFARRGAIWTEYYASGRGARADVERLRD